MNKDEPNKGEVSLDGTNKFTHTNSNSREGTLGFGVKPRRIGKPMRKMLPHNVYIIDKLPGMFDDGTKAESSGLRGGKENTLTD